MKRTSILLLLVPNNFWRIFTVSFDLIRRHPRESGDPGLTSFLILFFELLFIKKTWIHAFARMTCGLLICFFNQQIFCKEKETVQEIIDTHKKTLFQTYPTKTEQQQFTNDLVEQSFSGKQADLFLKMHSDKTQHESLQFLYTTMWSVLAEHGWCTWDSSCLKALKQEHDSGKTIVYIGGGCDIYELITNGIYNIIVIDPILPTQKNYYPDDYLYLIQGSGPDHGLNDQITGLAGNKRLTLKRSGFESMPDYISFSLPSGQQRCTQVSKTTWTVLDKKQHPIGTIIFDRRFTTQKDFELAPDRVLLFSWNELFFVINGEWGIKTNQFQDDITLFIKQLRKPITKEMIDNMHHAHELNRSKFKFIGLGSHVV